MPALFGQGADIFAAIGAALTKEAVLEGGADRRAGRVKPWREAMEKEKS